MNGLNIKDRLAILETKMRGIEKMLYIIVALLLGSMGIEVAI